MCIGIPMQVVDVREGVAIAERHGVREELNMMLLDDVRPGAWVLAFQGNALKALTETEALQTDRALQALQAALVGERDLGTYFADLVDREPQLPAHLRKKSA